MAQLLIDRGDERSGVFYTKSLLPGGKYIGPRYLEMWWMPVRRYEERFIDGGIMKRAVTVDAAQGEWTWGPHNLEGVTVKRQYNDIYRREEYIITKITFVNATEERANCRSLDKLYAMVDRAIR